MFIILCDAHERIVGANREFLDYLGAPEPDVVGQPIAQFAIGRLITEFLIPNDPPDGRARLKNRQGEELVVTLEVSELMADGLGPQLTVAVATLDDITLQTELEKLRRLSEAKSDIVKAVSYEFQHALTSIAEGVRSVRDGESGPVNDEQRAQLTRAVDDTARLTILVSEILDPSKIEAGRIEARPTRVDTSELLTRAANSHGTYSREKGLTLTLELPATPLFAWCDPSHYRRIVLNLLSNATKFTPTGG